MEYNLVAHWKQMIREDLLALNVVNIGEIIAWALKWCALTKANDSFTREIVWREEVVN